jgi:hypothetical protein
MLAIKWPAQSAQDNNFTFYSAIYVLFVLVNVCISGVSKPMSKPFPGYPLSPLKQKSSSITILLYAYYYITWPPGYLHSSPHFHNLSPSHIDRLTHCTVIVSQSIRFKSQFITVTTCCSFIRVADRCVYNCKGEQNCVKHNNMSNLLDYY